MPIDENGNRADVVMDALSTVARMNIGRLYEQYLGAAARDVSVGIRNLLNVHNKITIEALEKFDHGLIDKAYDYLLHFYNIVSDKQYYFFKHTVTAKERIEHLVDILNDGIYLYCPIDNQRNYVDVVKELEKHHKPTFGPVSYVGSSGQRVVTKDNVRIAPFYLMLLDKTAEDWSAVSTGKLQHFGVLSPMTKSEKFSNPFRNSPVRCIGETEGRIFASYCGREAIAEMMDRSNNPATQRNIVHNILSAPVPSNIDKVVDREYISLGNSRPINLIQHVFSCAGFKVVYEPEDKESNA